MLRSRPLALSLLAVLAGSGCGSAPSAPASEALDDFSSKSGEGDDLGALFGVSSAAISIAVPSCSARASSGFVATTGVFTLNLSPSNTTEVVIAPVGSTLRVNGFTCVDNTGTPIDLAKVTKLVVNGTAGDDAVIIDLYLGTFNAKTTGASGGGVQLLLAGGGMDRVGIRGTGGADTITAGSNAGRALVDFTGDGVADAIWPSTATRRELMIASAGGNDLVSGSGRSTALTAVPISASAPLAGTAVAAGGVGALTSAYRLSAFGGPGNDRIQGGDGNDLLDGGEGDDLFLTGATKDGADVFIGGLGTDTVDYSSRTGALTVTIALTSAANANDGESGESDDVTASVENVTGGSGNDSITGSGSGNVLRGGPGNDVMNGGPAGTCTTDVDLLFGDAGDDVFEMGAASDCGDELNGGAGTDVANYHDRGASLTISGDGTANDGETNEKDNVRTDVEVIVGGQGNDTITGSTVAVRIVGCAGDDVLTGSTLDDELSGGPGNDTLNGLAGSDWLRESGEEPLCYSVVRGITTSKRGLGSDVLNGGAGVEDKIDYSERVAALTVTLCVDAAAATGVGTCGTPRNDGEAGELDAVLNTEIVEGGSGNDSITGATADEWLNGNGGDDVLVGAGGNDQLDGGPGNNTLTGDGGADICRNYVQANSCDLHVYTCSGGWQRDCDNRPENACETEVGSNLLNCGACGIVCPSYANATAACTSGTCGISACSAGFANCDSNLANGCEINTRTDVNNCGACGNVCAAGQSCQSGACVSTWASAAAPTLVPGSAGCTLILDTNADQLDIASDGTVYVLMRCGGNLMVSRSLDNARTFSLPSRVPFTSLPDGATVLARSRDSVAVLGGQSFSGVTLARSDDGGATWSGPFFVGPNFSNSGPGPALSIAESAGNLFATWSYPSSTTEVFKSTNLGATWSSFGTIALAGSNYCPDLFVTSSGSLLLTNEVQREVFRSSTSSPGWSPYGTLPPWTAYTDFAVGGAYIYATGNNMEVNRGLITSGVAVNATQMVASGNYARSMDADGSGNLAFALADGSTNVLIYSWPAGAPAMTAPVSWPVGSFGVFPATAAIPTVRGSVTAAATSSGILVKTVVGP